MDSKKQTKVITKRPNGTLRVQTFNHEPSMTEQQFKEDTDVNIIMNKLLKKGIMPKFVSKTGTYGDFRGAPDYYEAMQNVARAQSDFNELPSKIRNRFNNDPQQLMDFLNDTKNDEEALKLGLITKTLETPDPALSELKEISKTLKQNNKQKSKDEAQD